MSYKQTTLARDKGRIAIVTNRGLGSDGRDGVGHHRHCRAASAVSNGLRAYDTAPTASRMASGASTRQLPEAQRGRARTNKSCGPDARGLCVKSCGDVTVQPGARISHLQGDGGNSATLPEESTKDTVKTIRAGKAGRPASPVIHPVCISKAHGSRVPAGARPSLRPFFEKGGKSKQSSGEMGRENGDVCQQVEA